MSSNQQNELNQADDLLALVRDLQQARIEHEQPVTTNDQIVRQSLERALSIYRTILHPLNLKVLEVQRLLLEVCSRQKDWLECISQIQACISAYEKIYEWFPCHPAISLRVFSLGNVYIELGQGARARNCFDKAATMINITHGPDHLLSQLLRTRIAVADKLGC